MERCYILFRKQRRITVKEDDMTPEKIGRLFQVSSSNLYLMDSANVAVFPASTGEFLTFDLVPRGLYEVHGDALDGDRSDLPGPSSAASAAPQRFSFARSSTSSASTSSAIPLSKSGGRSYQRSVFMAEVVNGKVIPNRMLAIRFNEMEANVPGILGKVQEALGSPDPIRLTDSQGNEILDTEGTRGLIYWKPGARKVLVLSEEEFTELQTGKRRRSSYRKYDEVGAISEVHEKIEELVLAAQTLQEVTENIKALGESAMVYVIKDDQAEKLKEAFCCSVCHGPMKDAMFATCCRTIIGCRGCVQRSLQESDQCVKCRAEGFTTNVHIIAGLGDALKTFENFK